MICARQLKHGIIFYDVFDLVRIHACGKRSHATNHNHGGSHYHLDSNYSTKDMLPRFNSNPNGISCHSLETHREHYPISYGKINGKTL